MEDFVPFEIAKKLEAKGFDAPCINAINRFKCTYRNGWCEYLDDRYEEFITREDLKPGDMLLPLIHQVLKWLRDDKKIHIEPLILVNDDTDADDKIISQYTYWSFSITSIVSGNMLYFEYYDLIDYRKFKSFEEAALAGIEYALDNLI